MWMRRLGCSSTGKVWTDLRLCESLNFFVSQFMTSCVWCACTQVQQQWWWWWIADLYHTVTSSQSVCFLVSVIVSSLSLLEALLFAIMLNVQLGAFLLLLLLFTCAPPEARGAARWCSWGCRRCSFAAASSRRAVPWAPSESATEGEDKLNKMWRDNTNMHQAPSRCHLETKACYVIGRPIARS